jgi:hypothetical protein
MGRAKKTPNCAGPSIAAPRLSLRHPCCPIYPRHPYLPKGAKGAGVRWPSAVLVSSLASPNLRQGAASASRAGKGLKAGSPSCRSSIDPRLDIETACWCSQSRSGQKPSLELLTMGFKLLFAPRLRHLQRQFGFPLCSVFAEAPARSLLGTSTARSHLGGDNQGGP